MGETLKALELEAQAVSNGLSLKQQIFENHALDGDNIFLTGKAGTGKTFIVKRVIRELKKQGKKVIAIAPTGIAANNLGGQTIHSLFSLQPFGILDFYDCKFVKPEKRKVMDMADVIVIDEISMLRPDILDAINSTLIRNGCGNLEEKQIIFIGDLKQLQAPLKDNERSILLKRFKGEEFFNAKIYPKLNVVNIELDEVLRQSNNEFIENLNIIRDGGKSDYFKRFVCDEARGIILAPHNATADSYNIKGLSSIEAETINFKAIIDGDIKPSDFNVEELISVKHGAKIMYLANSKDYPLVNGTLGIFIRKNGANFIEVDGAIYPISKVRFDKSEYRYDEEKEDFKLFEVGSIEQTPIRLAYALSIHKSQGLTFDEVTVDLTKPCFASGQLYVALSRVTSPDGLRIITNGRGMR